MTKAEQFAKLNGIEWNTTDPSHINPFFTDAKSILEVMMKRKDWDEFLKIIGWDSINKIIKSVKADVLDCEVTIHGVDVMQLEYILNPDKLLDAATEWCEKGEKP